MGAFQKFVEWGTDAKYVAIGKKCDICGERLNFFETGFWSTNAKQITDGVLCRHCFEKLEKLRDYRKFWVPKSKKKEIPFCYLDGNRLFLLDAEKAKLLLESAESLAREEVASIGPDYGAVFRMKEACFIEPTALQVGVKRAKQLENKLVLFGYVQLGQFKKGDKVLIRDNDGIREATVLEAYVYDPEVPENNLEVMLKAHMGKQQLSQWQTGWLVLDDEETVTDHTTVIG